MFNPQPSNEADGEVSRREIAPVIELGCCVVLLISPLIRWVNGPAVTTDQFVAQFSLVVLALFGAVGLRAHRWRRRKRSA
jgi:hypothetical protein